MDADPSYHAYLDAAASECRACPDCWDVPCGGCLAGGVCDEICNCDDGIVPAWDEHGEKYEDECGDE